MSGTTPPGKRKDLGPGNRGISTSGCLIYLILLLLLGFVGLKVGQAFWNYYNVREQVREALTWAVGSIQPKAETDIIQRVISNSSGVGIQLSARNIRVSQTPESLTIKVNWTEELDFPYYTYPLNFEVILSEIKRWGRGGLVVK